MEGAGNDQREDEEKDDDEAEGLKLPGTGIGWRARFVSTSSHASIVARRVDREP